MQLSHLAAADGLQVAESAFGKWFLGTQTWETHVLERALTDLERLIPSRTNTYPVILDAGCGHGRSFKFLNDRFAPVRIIGVDIDPVMISAAEAEVQRNDLTVDLICADCAKLPLASASADLLFCHQSFHHVVAQYEALSEFYRVLKPGGLLLFAESTRHYIHSWPIRLLFRHPMHVQREAGEYIEMFQRAGFQIDDRSVSYPYLWWSRPDIGLQERLLGIKPAKDHPETLVNFVAIR